MKKLFLLVSLALCCQFAAFPAVFNVRDYGAKGDGTTIDSPAINAAIQAAAADGGGVVFFPKGCYASYSIRLASHIELNLEKGAVILAAKPTADAGYDLAEDFEYGREYQDYGHSHWKNSLMWGIGLEDIVITGYGLIDGSGLVPDYGDIRDFRVAPLRGNKAISLKNCHNVTLENFTMYNCGHFALLATGVDNLIIRGLVVDTQRDGLDIDCCRNVLITGCRLNCPWDDAIVLKASYALGKFKDTEDVIISDCHISGFKEGTMLNNTNLPPTEKPGYTVSPDTRTQAPFIHRGTGRIKFGTESSGGFRNIAVSNCTIDYCGGILLETVDGGTLEDVVFSNLTIRGTNAPLFFRLGARMRSPENTPVGVFRRVLITDINVSDADPRWPILISGIPGHRIENVTVRNFHVQFQGGLTPADALPADAVPENEDKYPEMTMFGTIPAKGMYLRHIDGIELDGIHFSFMKPDSRPLVIKDDVSNIKMRNITVEGEDVTSSL